MKKTILFLLILSTLAIPVKADSMFENISVFSGVTVASPDLDEGHVGTRFGVRDYFSPNWGVQLSADTRHIKHDYNVGAALLFRVPVMKASLDFEAGPTYAVDRRDFGLVVLGGPSYQWNKHISTSIKTGARKWFGSQSRIESLSTVEIGFHF